VIRGSRLQYTHGAGFPVRDALSLGEREDGEDGLSPPETAFLKGWDETG